MLPWIKKNNNWLKATAVVLFLLAVAFLFLDISLAHAQDTFGLQPVGDTVNLGSQDIRIIIGKIVRAVLGLLGIIVTVIILYAGFLIMTSGGEEEKITKGKRTMINAVIGLAIILSALAIVQFVLNSLTGTGLRGRSGAPGTPVWDSFAGSGALGRVVKDHYPYRDQVDVPRNTKITVTFAEAVDPASLIENTNNTCWPQSGANTPVLCSSAEANVEKPYYGDCIVGGNFSWETNCDHLKNQAVSIYQSTSTPYSTLVRNNPEVFVSAASMAAYEWNANIQEFEVFTFVFKPYNPQYLGSSEENVPYTVRLTEAINKKSLSADEDPISIFIGQYQNYYFWEFETGINLDLTPPYVKSVRPVANSVVPKNNIVQVYFNEPVDPTVAQGYLTPEALDINLFFDLAVTGTWKLSNGYTVAEFVSDVECGVNSCGEKMYCLPLPRCTNPSDKDCAQNYQAMVRAGRLLNSDSFEAEPFSGVMDMAGNALDGDNDGTAEQRPSSDLTFVEQKKPDNYFWAFIVQNRIDRVAPVVETFLPEIDKEGVKGRDSLKIRFSRVMWLSTLNSPGTFLTEYPTAVEASAGKDFEVRDVLGFYLRSDLVKSGSFDKTELTFVPTREFGPYNLDLYYFPQVYSSVKTETQNCLYPGRGSWGLGGATPQKGTAPVCVYDEDEAGNVLMNENCIPVSIDSETDTGCAETTVPSLDNILAPNVAKCLETMEENSVWVSDTAE